MVYGRYHLIFHKSAWEQTFSSFYELLHGHHVNCQLLLVILIQHTPIVAQGYPSKIKCSPMWLAPGLSDNILLNTIGQSINRVRFTWILRLIQFLMSDNLIRVGFTLNSLLSTWIIKSYLPLLGLH